MITVIADDGKNKIGYELYQALVSQGTEADYVSLEDVEVKPCVNCGGCKYKSFGRCVVRDDGDWIYPKIVRSDVLVMVTPIVFGSWSLKVKCVLDKFGLFMDCHYHVADGELVKGGMAGRTFKCFAVGVSAQGDAREAEAFVKLLRETLIITQGAGKAFITGASLTDEVKADIIREVARA